MYGGVVLNYFIYYYERGIFFLSSMFINFFDFSFLETYTF